MYLVLRHVGGSRDSGTGCALVGVSRHNFTNVYSVLCIFKSNKTSSFLINHFSSSHFEDIESSMPMRYFPEIMNCASRSVLHARAF